MIAATTWAATSAAAVSATLRAPSSPLSGSLTGPELDVEIVTVTETSRPSRSQADSDSDARARPGPATSHCTVTRTGPSRSLAGPWR